MSVIDMRKLLVALPGLRLYEAVLNDCYKHTQAAHYAHRNRKIRNCAKFQQAENIKHETESKVPKSERKQSFN